MRTVGVAVVAAVFVVSGCGAGSTRATKTITSYITAEPLSSPASSPAPQAMPSTTPTPAGPRDSISADGTYVVGVDIQPGVYRTRGTMVEGLNCFWKRLSSLNTRDIIDTNDSSGPQTIEIMPTDKAFATERCQTWIKVG